MFVSLGMPPPLHPEPLAAQGELFNLEAQRYKSIEMNFPNYSFYEKIVSVPEKNDIKPIY